MPRVADLSRSRSTIVLPARATSWVRGDTYVRRLRALLDIRTLEQFGELHGAGVWAGGVGLQAPLVLFDLRFAAVFDGVDRRTARTAGRLSRRRAECRQVAVSGALLCGARTEQLLQLVACGMPAARVGVNTVDVCTELGGAVPLNRFERSLHFLWVEPTTLERRWSGAIREERGGLSLYLLVRRLL